MPLLTRVLLVAFLIILIVSPTKAFGTTIRVLLLDESKQTLPSKTESFQRLKGSKGTAYLTGLKYSGNIEVWRSQKGIYIINEVPLEEYVKGVVVSEVGSSWDLEALKAQAVVARTYALSQGLKTFDGNFSYHVSSTVLHQAYKQIKIPESVDKAVNETAGEILLYDSAPIIAYYHSTSGGMTEDPVEVFGKSYPYLKPVQTNSDLSPYAMWEKRIPYAELSKALDLPTIEEIAIDSYTVSGRVRNFKIKAGGKEYIFNAKDVRRLLGWQRLPSTFITALRDEDSHLVLEGKGFGHGVGMCQWSALQMAKDGLTYTEILQKFYPGATLSKFLK